MRQYFWTKRPKTNVDIKVTKSDKKLCGGCVASSHLSFAQCMILAILPLSLIISLILKRTCNKVIKYNNNGEFFWGKNCQNQMLWLRWALSSTKSTKITQNSVEGALKSILTLSRAWNNIPHKSKIIIALNLNWIQHK